MTKANYDNNHDNVRKRMKEKRLKKEIELLENKTILIITIHICSFLILILLMSILLLYYVFITII